MKVAIIGYGKMGKAIERILLDRGHEVVARFGSKGIDRELLQPADVAIEFSIPETAVENLNTCFDLSVPVVCGTTGWLDHYSEVTKRCLDTKGALLYASNFSLGVNIFFAVNDHLAGIMNGFEDYDISIEEIHHTQKLDAPSGTAITLAQQITDKIDRKNAWSLNEHSHPSQIQIDAKRIDDVPGTHEVRYSSEIDTIDIRHTAHSRTGFALGAVVAAEFLQNRHGIFSMKDVLKL